MSEQLEGNGPSLEDSPVQLQKRKGSLNNFDMRHEVNTYNDIDSSKNRFGNRGSITATKNLDSRNKSLGANQTPSQVRYSSLSHNRAGSTRVKQSLGLPDHSTSKASISAVSNDGRRGAVQKTNQSALLPQIKTKGGNSSSIHKSMANNLSTSQQQYSRAHAIPQKRSNAGEVYGLEVN